MAIADVITPVLIAGFGSILGYFLKALYDDLALPVLRLETETYPVEVPNFTLTENLLGISPADLNLFQQVTLVTYRARVTNEQRRLLNAAAENCIAWLDIDGVKEHFQTNWVGGIASVTINVGDHRDLGFCALAQGYSAVFAPTETGYPKYPQKPRIIGIGVRRMSGTLRVTSSNSRTVRRRFTIEVNAPPSGLQIRLEAWTEGTEAHRTARYSPGLELLYLVVTVRASVLRISNFSI